jgi:hypothetical protein
VPAPHSWKQHQDDLGYQNGETEGDAANLQLTEDCSGYLMAWNQGNINVFVPLAEGSNLPTIYGKSSYAQFTACAAAFQCHPTIIPDDDDDMPATMQMVDEDNDDLPVLRRQVPANASESDDEHVMPPTIPLHDEGDETNDDARPSNPLEVDFNTEADTTTAVSIDDLITPRDEALFLSWHLKMGHAPFRNIQ